MCLVHVRNDKDMLELKEGTGLTMHAIGDGLLNWHSELACACDELRESVRLERRIAWCNVGR